MSVVLRPAREEDQASIRSLVRASFLNPSGLAWQRFVVAEDQGRIVGVGQVKTLKDGSRELASIGVLGDWRGKGIAGQIIRCLLEQESGPVYGFCLEDMESFYTRFGCRRVARLELPRLLATRLALARVAALFASILARRRLRVVAMTWEPPAKPPTGVTRLDPQASDQC